MEVILLKAIRNLGKVGDLVSVKSGYANHYLIPQGYASYATHRMKEYYDSKIQALQKQEQVLIDAARVVQERMDKKEIIAEVHADKKSGALYGSYNATRVVQLIKDKFDYDIHHTQIIMPLIKLMGAYQVTLYPHPEVPVTITLNLIIRD